MQQLPNNCRAGNMSVYPANWKTVRANPRLTWRIKYRFYDDNLNQEKQVVIKGMNDFQTADEKRDAVKILIAEETDLILNHGYNRITGTYSTWQDDEITPFTPFADALQYAYDHSKVSKTSRKDLKSVLLYLIPAADALRYSRMPVSNVKRKHLILLLEKCGELKKKAKVVLSVKKGKTKPGIWTAHTFNWYRSNLSILYKYLLKLEVVDANYVHDIDKEKAIKKIRQTLTKAERLKVNEVLFAKTYEFWRLLQIFFSSGARETEIMQVQKRNIDIENQRFKVVVKKGQSYQEEWRTIRTIVLPLWIELLNISKPNDYIFSVGLVPGPVSISTHQIARRWRRHVKVPLSITADFYSVKHTNLDEIAGLLSIREASLAAGHSSTVITMKHYAQGEKERQHNRLKDVNNQF